ncbi:MAG TPA: rhodanese-like domain-containing protein [Pyrinomonadaceae bacterium]|nr:rhodanese-like domain-containing protein [Pyrinomonadaceae bacterium]
MRLFTYSIALLLLSISFAACNAIDSKVNSHAQKVATPGPTPVSDGARRITIDELEALIKENKVLVLDVRTQDSFDAGHIPGSKLVPAGEVQNHLKELPHDKMIVTYCS